MTQQNRFGSASDPASIWQALLATQQRDVHWQASLALAERPADCQGLSDVLAAKQIEARYAPLAQPRGDQLHVIAQLGQSLDGRIATVNGHSHYVTGVADRAHLHRLRALSDAVLVGAGTVVADDPQLTVRAVAGPNPIRVITASRALSPDYRVFQDNSAPTWLISSVDRPFDVPVPSLHQQLTLPELTPPAIAKALTEAGVRRVLIEGGARTVSAWLAAGLIDHLYCVIAPVIIGDGPIGINLPAIGHMDEALRPQVSRYSLGEDTLFRLDF